ncbi:MAG TPA: sigma-70 family RNA polymerase sigma factor [Pirellulales bacterium]|jgi:RNA polymerase sigma-70 factor (ECF subfamily)|nr:sigma-70 family RNA polymerase sigma factor [Pirellulales bacterium]
MANEPASTGAVAPGEQATQAEASSPLDVARLVREHQAGVWRYLRVLGCPAAEAEDLTQETFLAVLTKPFHDYNRQATAAYLRQVARNLFISSRRRTVAVAELDEAEAAWLRWAIKDDGQELMEALHACLQKLTERARQALDMRFGRQAARAEIAATLGLSEDGAKNLMQRAKQQLRACVEKAVARGGVVA